MIGFRIRNRAVLLSAAQWRSGPLADILDDRANSLDDRGSYTKADVGDLPASVPGHAWRSSAIEGPAVRVVSDLFLILAIRFSLVEQHCQQCRDYRKQQGIANDADVPNAHIVCGDAAQTSQRDCPA